MRASLLLLTGLACFLSGCGGAPQRIQERSESGSLGKTGELSNGKQVGRWTYYYPGGAKRAQGDFKNDCQDGTWTYWYEDGRKEMEGDYSGERRSGDWTYWYPSGAQRAQGRFVADLETGVWTFWHENGKRSRSGHFENGNLAHRWTYWNDLGQLVAEGFFLDGSKVGSWKLRGEDGELSERSAPLPAGSKIIQERSGNGDLRREGFLHDGKAEGRWVSWHQNGKMRLLGDFKNGEPEGEWEAFDADGDRLAVGPVSHGRLTGEWMVNMSGKSAALHLTGLRSPPLVRGEWSEDSLYKKRPAEDVLTVWLAEMCAPVDEAAAGYAFASAKLKDTSAYEPGAPTAGAQVELTFFQRENLARIVSGYEKGGISYSQSSNLPTMSLGAGASAYVDRTERAGGARGDDELAREILGKAIPAAELRDTEGSRLSLEPYRGKKNVLLVILRGFDGRVCEYCAGQTMALGRNREEFQKRQTEVLVVYPGSESRLEAFLEAYRNQFRAQPPRFRFLYDSDLDFSNALSIGPPEGKLARPTVILLDKSGKAVFAYVGTRKEDRPTVERLLAVIDNIGSSEPAKAD